MRRILLLILVNVASILLLLLVAELVVRAFTDSYFSHKEFRMTQPAPYVGAPYYSKEFITESFMQPGGWKYIRDSNLILPNDFEGRYFTVKNGIRRTTDIPASANKSIYLFGGSTVYNSEVPDEFTIASYLQRMLISGGYDQYRVVNLGVTSVTTNQQLARLKVTELNPGDIVIFYDGVNDVIQGVLYGNSGNTIYSSDLSRPYWQKVLSRLANISALARLILSRMNANFKIVNLDKRIDETASSYRRNIDESEMVVKKRGGIFIHILQPNLYTLTPHGDYEKTLLNAGLIPAQAEEAFRSSYPRLQQIVLDRKRHKHLDYDLTTVFNGINMPLYLDFCHINHAGNQIIADRIYKILVSSGSIDDKDKQ